MNMSRTTKGRKVPTFRPYCQIDPIRRGTALTKIFPEKKKLVTYWKPQSPQTKHGTSWDYILRQPQKNLQWTSRKFPMRGFSNWMMNSTRQLIQRNDNSKPIAVDSIKQTVVVSLCHLYGIWHIQSNITVCCNHYIIFTYHTLLASLRTNKH